MREKLIVHPYVLISICNFLLPIGDGLFSPLSWVILHVRVVDEPIHHTQRSCAKSCRLVHQQGFELRSAASLFSRVDAVADDDVTDARLLMSWLWLMMIWTMAKPFAMGGTFSTTHSLRNSHMVWRTVHLCASDMQYCVCWRYSSSPDITPVYDRL